MPANPGAQAQSTAPGSGKFRQVAPFRQGLRATQSSKVVSQRRPEKPGGQTQAPVLASQLPPFWQAVRRQSGEGATQLGGSPEGERDAHA